MSPQHALTAWFEATRPSAEPTSPEKAGAGGEGIGVWARIEQGLRGADLPGRSRVDDIAATSRSLAIADIQRQLDSLVAETASLRTELAKLAGPHVH